MMVLGQPHWKDVELLVAGKHGVERGQVSQSFFHHLPRASTKTRCTASAMLRLQGSPSTERDLLSIRAHANPCEVDRSDVEYPIRKTLKWPGAAQRESPRECRSWSRIEGAFVDIKKKRYSFS